MLPWLHFSGDHTAALCSGHCWAPLGAKRILLPVLQPHQLPPPQGRSSKALSQPQGFT